MQVGDLVKFEDVFGNDERVALVLEVNAHLVKTTFGWVGRQLLEVLNASR